MVFENSQRPSTNRTARSANVNMSQQQQQQQQQQQHHHEMYVNDSPPRTPPSQNTKYKPASRGLTARPSLRETFFDANDNAKEGDSGDDERDPHDLSLSPKHITRTSVVDNMLLSLDQFAVTGSSFLDDSRLFGSSDPDPYNFGSRYSGKQGRNRGHTFSSSLSSDVEVNSEDTSGRHSSQSTRGHRSNSSSTFQPGLRRIDSVRGRDGTSTRGQVYEAQRASGPGERSQGGRSHFARKGSKSSVSSSIDFGQMMAGSRIGGERRSASFDYDSRPPFVSLSDSMPGQDMLQYDLDAAPTPTVPAGPRRNHEPSSNDYSAVQNYPPSRTPALSRKNSTKSAKSTHIRKGRSETLGTASIKARDNEFKNLRESVRDLPPPIPASYANPPAPSPTISFNKPYIPPAEPTPGKERSGFFRRVFGSSKNSSPAQSDYQHTTESPYSQETELRDPNAAVVTPKGWKQAPKQNLVGGPPSRETSQPVVNKKPSFFRRRKKSVADHVPPPIVLPPQNGLRPSDQIRPEPSPVSSLRKVMNPYLADVLPPMIHDSKEYADQEIPNDNVNNDISVDGRAQNVHNPRERSSLVPKEQRRESASAKSGALRTKYSLNLDIPNQEQPESFLADSSGNEDLNSKASYKSYSAVIPEEKSQRPRTSPVSPSHKKAALVDPQEPFAKSNLPLTAGVSLSEADKEADSAHATSQSKGGFLNGVSAPTSSLSTENRPRRRSASAESSKEMVSPKNKAVREGKGWLDPGSPDELLDGSSRISLPIGGESESPRASTSDVSNYITASNTPVIPAEDPKSNPNASSDETTEDDVDDEKLSMADKEQAQRIFDNQDQLVVNEPAAAWLGHPDRATVRKVYMELFNWSNTDILAALRSLCTRIALKGETQQVDRVLDSFSTRWCECNPCHGFKATDVVHTICYSLLLLNTDLHLADIEQKMTRTQFVRNTMPTIHRVAADAAPDGFETIRATNKSKLQTAISDSALSALSSVRSPPSDTGLVDMDNPNKAASKRGERLLRVDSTTTSDGDTGPLVNTPFNGTMRAWEVQVETVLKNFYNSIQKQRLPLYGAQTGSDEYQQNNLLGPNGNTLRRTPSTLSKSGSDIYPRGRSAESRFATPRWSSKPRSRARLYPASNMGSSRTSLDDQSSVWSPSASSTWSKYSLGKTLTSMSVDSFGSQYPRGDYQQSIGFANALSQAIIREDSANSITSLEDTTRTTPFLEDETLELAGAPWAKEGSLKHKHHLDSVDKRAKDRNWNECFAVIQQGWMRLFSFNASTRSMRQKKQRQNGGVVVGGGNWTENAEEVWKFLLRQTIASALPPPGYSKSRPHVWALSLPTGAVHLFQVGTPEIVKEFVTTANYWSARLSKEPLVGGISNIEYGWSETVINSALIHTDTRSPPSSSGAARASLQSSIRSSIDQQVVRPRLPADRVVINDWSPPQQSMVASTLSEAEQLKALQTYVKNVETELQKHNELRPAMVLAFSPRHPNAAKAMGNWERKSSYLLREIVKFRTYIDCLQAAQVQKEKFYMSQHDHNDSNDQSCERPTTTNICA